MTRRRLRMRLSLVEREPPAPWTARAFEPSDATAVGTLMLAAYRGTVDDEGETEADAIAEVERVVAGAYGPFLRECSFVVEHGVRIVGASMVTSFGSRPFLTFVVVDPSMQRRGIGDLLVATSGNALVAAGHQEMDLVVTEANEPAVNLYRKLGFRVVERVGEPAPDA